MGLGWLFGFASNHGGRARGDVGRWTRGGFRGRNQRDARAGLVGIPEERDEDKDYESDDMKHTVVPCDAYGGATAPTTAYTQPSIMSRVYMVMDEYRLTLQLLFLFLGIIILWECANHCVPCIFVLMIVSCFFCLEYRLVNLLLWACIVVLWLHGWTFSTSTGSGLHASMGWDRR